MEAFMNGSLQRTRRAVLAALVLGGLVCLPNLASAETTLEKVKRTKVMTAGNSGSYPPFEMMEGTKLIGFDVDMADEIGKRMGGIQVKFEVMDFKGLLASLTSKRVDTLITALTYTPERANAIAFSVPYYDAGIGAIIKDGSGIAKPDDLAGKIVGVQLGSSGDAFVRQTLGTKVKEIKTYDTILLAVKDLDNGRVQAVVNPIPVLRHNAKGLKGLTTTSVWDKRVVGINTRKEDTDLLAEINKHIEAMQKDGTMERLDKKWFGG
jgi:ABC-type amino acid transport substrate-binding protein